MINIIHGNTLDILKQIPDNYIKTIVTSPPYYQLRDYHTARWCGGDINCDHQSMVGEGEISFLQTKFNRGSSDFQYTDVCKKCSAIRIDNQIGLEKSPKEYIGKLIEIFNECMRVLKKDGLCWVNIGDTYATKSGTYGNRKEWKGLHKNSLDDSTDFKQPNPKDIGLKHKDLIGIPWMFAFAMRDNGWYLRQDIIWQKLNCMPNSCRDRFTRSHEYIFMFAKSKKYYYDYNESLEESRRSYGRKPSAFGSKKYRNTTEGVIDKNYSNNQFGKIWKYDKPLRNRRSVISTSNSVLKENHFASYPIKLIEPFIKISCKKDEIVLDPFNGSGSTMVASFINDKNGIGIDLSKDYCDISYNRILEKIGLYEENVDDFVKITDRFEIA